jgi:hypothetical protein
VLAPLALIATALVAFLIIRAAVDDSDQGSSKAERTTTSTATASCPSGEPPDAEAVKNGYYVLQAGENLSTVAEKTCISVDQIEELNPNLDTQSLPVGGCVDLVVDGCKALAQG